MKIYGQAHFEAPKQSAQRAVARKPFKVSHRSVASLFRVLGHSREVALGDWQLWRWRQNYKVMATSNDPLQIANRICEWSSQTAISSEKTVLQGGGRRENSYFNHKRIWKLSHIQLFFSDSINLPLVIITYYALYRSICPSSRVYMKAI